MSKRSIQNAYKILGQEYYAARKEGTGSSYFYNELLEFPATLKLLGNVKGKKILDMGCGPGIHTKKLFDMGAKIKGIDFSQKLIEFAKNEAPEVEFKVGDITKLPYKDSEFDIVFASLVLGHLKNWDRVFSEVKRVLKKNGVFIFSNYNPVTEKFIKSRWMFKKFRKLEGYFNEGKKTSEWKKHRHLSADVIHYHKTYSTVIKTIIANGFEIVDYEDCKPLKSGKRFSWHYQNSLNYPHFCVWKIKKKN